MLRTILILMLISFSTVSMAATDVLQFKTGVEIDGINKEWASPLPEYHKKTGINYSVSNDLKNIYLIVRISDEKIIRQVTKNGLEIWIDKDGKKNKTSGISYPVPVKKVIDFAAIITNTQTEEKKDVVKEPLKKGLLTEKNLKLTGYYIENGEQPVAGCEVKVAASIDEEGVLVYEFALPFNTFYKESLDQDDVKTKFAIGFIVKDVELEMPTEMPRMGDMRAMAMMGGFGGGMPGGGMSAMTKSDTPEKEFWIVVKPSLK